MRSCARWNTFCGENPVASLVAQLFLQRGCVCSASVTENHEAEHVTWNIVAVHGELVREWETIKRIHVWYVFSEKMLEFRCGTSCRGDLVRTFSTCGRSRFRRQWSVAQKSHSDGYQVVTSIRFLVAIKIMSYQKRKQKLSSRRIRKKKPRLIYVEIIFPYRVDWEWAKI